MDDFILSSHYYGSPVQQDVIVGTIDDASDGGQYAHEETLAFSEGNFSR